MFGACESFWCLVKCRLDLCCKDCLIILPALPMEPTRFPEPLRSFVILISEVFDEQKVIPPPFAT